MHEDAVLVTGANGFVGSHIVSLLLSKGFVVHATVRRQDALDDLTNTFKSARLQTFLIPDLTAPQALEEAISQCRYVVHVASTVPSKDISQRPSIDDTVWSIESVMQAASQSGCQKVVLTSSMSAHLDIKAPILDESTWYTPDIASAKPFVQYMSAKTLAERRAWELSHSLGLPLTTVAPVYIGGPTVIKGQDPKSPVSNQDLLRYIADEAKSWIPGWIDVRTVAYLHLLALQAGDLDGRRVLACTHNRGVIHMDCTLMDQMLTTEATARIEFEKTQQDLLQQINAFEASSKSL